MQFAATFQSGFSSAFCSRVYGAMIFGYGLYELATGHVANVRSGEPARAGLVGRRDAAFSVFFMVMRFRPGRNG